MVISYLSYCCARIDLPEYHPRPDSSACLNGSNRTTTSSPCGQHHPIWNPFPITHRTGGGHKKQELLFMFCPQTHKVHKSVPSCPLYSPRVPYICPAPATLTSTQTLACSATPTSLACNQWDEVYWCAVKERAGSWFGVSEPNLAAQPNKTFFKTRNCSPPLTKTRHFGGQN